MRKICLFFVAFVPFTFSWAQNYTPLLDERNEWQLTSCYFGCLTDIYFTDGDTIVNNQNYKILDGYHYISRTFLLREEVDNQKVFLAKLNEGNQVDEFLLYDFSLQENDSIEMRNPISPFPLNSGYYKLDSIRHLPLVDQELYKHFYFNPTIANQTSSTPAVWVEGIGSLSMINAPGGFPDINGVGEISCFFKNQTLFYENLDSISSCKSVLKVKDPIDTNLPTIYYKNSTKSYFLQKTKQVKSLAFFDSLGREIHLKPEFFLDEIKIDVSSLNSGVYYILAYLENSRRKSYKIVVK